MSSFPGDDTFYRSHFEHANHLADRSYEQVRPAYRLGQDAALDADHASQTFEEVEQDLENGWLNVRLGSGEWSSVRDLARVAFDRTRQGRIPNAPSADATPNRPPFADPLGAAIDPDVPDHPERL